jgi:hypothetical protein
MRGAKRSWRASRQAEAVLALDESGVIKKDLVQGHAVIDRDVLERAERHGRRQRLVGMLHDGGAAAILNRPEPGGAVRHPAGPR